MRNEKNTEHTVACGTWTRIGFIAHKERNGILMPVALAVGSHLSERQKPLTNSHGQFLYALPGGMLTS